MTEVYEARICPGIPTDCCDYGVISHATGKEVCRVWTEEDARRIADLLNASRPPVTDAGEVREKVAAIIDPAAFGDQEILRNLGAFDERPQRKKAALIKAGAILALLATPSRSEGGWQDIATAPKDDTRILAFLPFQWGSGEHGEAIDVIAWSTQARHWYFPTPKNYVQACEVQPTHWRPLPAPPAAAIRKLGE